MRGLAEGDVWHLSPFLLLQKHHAWSALEEHFEEAPFECPAIAPSKDMFEGAALRLRTVLFHSSVGLGAPGLSMPQRGLHLERQGWVEREATQRGKMQRSIPPPARAF